MFSLQVPSRIWNFIRHNQFRISHSFNIYWAPTKLLYTLSHVPDPMPSGLVSQWPKTQTEGIGEHVLLRTMSTSEQGCMARLPQVLQFSSKGHKLHYLLIWSQKQMDLHSVKTEYGHLRTLSNELCCPIQTKCLAEIRPWVYSRKQAGYLFSKSVVSTFWKITFLN